MIRVWDKSRCKCRAYAVCSYCLDFHQLQRKLKARPLRPFPTNTTKAVTIRR